MINSMPFNWNKFRLTCVTWQLAHRFVLKSKVFDIGRAVFEKGVTVVVLEIFLSEKAFIEVECNLETVDNGGKSALLNTKETAILYILLTDNG